MKKYNTLNLLFLMSALIAVTLTLVFIANKYILTINFYERNGQPVSGIPDMESLVYDRIKSTIYIYTVIYLIAKVFVITIILATGLYFVNVEVPFGKLMHVVILCEFIFILPAAAKICWFWQERSIVGMMNWQNFYFLSASSFFEEIKPSALLPLQTINVFEFCYWILLADGISGVSGVQFGKAFKVVSLSYVPALIIWVVFVVFFTIIIYPQSY